MIPCGDYGSDMGNPVPLDDATTEAVLAGREVGPELEPLRWVVLAYRDAGRLPVPPRGELAVRMATGAFRPRARRTTSGARHRTRLRDRPGPAARVTNLGRRIRMAVMTGLTAAAAKLAGLGVAAKAAAGIAVATAGITTAGATGALPEPAQDRFDSVVETVTGDGGSSAPGGSGGNAEFGERVSEDAKDGGVDGGEISEEAKQQGGGHAPGGAPAPHEAGKPTELPTPDERPTAPADLPSAVPSDPGATAPTAPPGR